LTEKDSFEINKLFPYISDNNNNSDIAIHE